MSGGRVVYAEPTFWKRHADRLPQPWRSYAHCHGNLRGCHWHPRWRDAIACRLLHHDWYEVWDDGSGVMCNRCGAGPVYREDEEAWSDIIGDAPVTSFLDYAMGGRR